MSNNETPILCLASWYPNELDAFEGDFIERKMMALSLYRNVEVFHVKKHNSTLFDKTKTVTEKGKLKATVLYNKVLAKGLLSSIKNYLQLIKTHNIYLKHFISEHGNPKVILVQVPYNAGLIAWYWKRKFKIDYILTEHYGIYNDRYEQNFNKRSWLYKFIVKGIIRNANKLVTVSHSLAEDINNWVTQKEHIKISNVVQTEHFVFKEKTSPEPFIFCHLSNMIPVKNIPGIIEAVHLLSQKRNDFVLHLIGNENEKHVAQASQLGIKDKLIIFKNVIPYKQVAQTLQASHALIMFSNTESQSCISLEALCTGTPVISSNAGGIEEHLNNSNSIIVERGNSQELAKAMDTMINNYAHYNQKEIATENQALWNYKTIGAQYNRLIEDVLSQ